MSITKPSRGNAIKTNVVSAVGAVVGASIGTSIISSIGNSLSTNTSLYTNVSLRPTDAAHWTNIFVKEYKADLGSIDLSSLSVNLKDTSFARGGLTQSKNLQNLSNIKLPIPLQLSDTNSVLYNAEGLLPNLGEEGSNIMKDLTRNDATASIATSAAKMLMASSGIAITEFVSMLFKGPSYKKFSLSWKLSPKNAQESEYLNKIITQMKNAQAASAMAGPVFKYPKVFYLSFISNGKENNYLYKFKPAVLETFSVNYSGGGVPAFYKGTGAPESVILECQFIELEFWLEGDF